MMLTDVLREKFPRQWYIQKISLVDPDNKVVLQRVNELRALLKLLGKDKEVLIGKIGRVPGRDTQETHDFFGRP